MDSARSAAAAVIDPSALETSLPAADLRGAAFPLGAAAERTVSCLAGSCLSPLKNRPQPVFFVE